MQFPDRGRKYSPECMCSCSRKYWEMQFPDRGRKLIRYVFVVFCITNWEMQFPDRGRKFQISYSFQRSVFSIEKCSSPTGDGNQESFTNGTICVGLRNAVPRQGTETIFPSIHQSIPFADWEMQFPDRGRKHGSVNLHSLFSYWEMQFPDRGRKHFKIYD